MTHTHAGGAAEASAAGFFSRKLRPILAKLLIVLVLGICLADGTLRANEVQCQSLHSTQRPSIDRDRRTIDIAGERRGEKSHEMPNVVRLTEVASGNVLPDELSL